jgi:hypothetical protein
MFEKYAIVSPVTHTFEKDPDYWWKIRPALLADEIELARFLQEGRVVIDEKGEKITFPWSIVESAVFQLSTLFAGTNLVDEKGKELLPENAKREKVADVLKTFPTAVVLELWSALGEAVPGWGNASNRSSKN